MTSGIDGLLPTLRAMVAKQTKTLRKQGLSLKLDDSRAEWDKGSLSLAIDGEDFLGQLTVWSTGEAELECAEIATGEVRREHRDLASVPDLSQAFDELVYSLSGGKIKRPRGNFRRRGPQFG